MECVEAVQGHPRSLILVPIESAYITWMWLDFHKNIRDRIQAFEVTGYCKILRVSWMQKKSNKWIVGKIDTEPALFPSMQTRKLTL